LPQFVQAITGQPSPDSSDAAADQLSQWAEHAGRPGLLPLVVVDEFDALAQRLDDRFLERLRGMLDRLQWVLGSRRNLDEIKQEVGLTSPFYNRLQLIWLGLLEADAAEQLLRSADRPLTDADREEMQRWAGRHPFFLQLLGYHLVQARFAGGSTAPAIDAFRLEAARNLRDLWRTIGDRQREMLMGVQRGVAASSLPLRTRGLVTEEGQLFAWVLADWMREEL
jgi:hypothetical protein